VKKKNYTVQDGAAGEGETITDDKYFLEATCFCLGDDQKKRGEMKLVLERGPGPLACCSKGLKSANYECAAHIPSSASSTSCRLAKYDRFEGESYDQVDEVIKRHLWVVTEPGFDPDCDEAYGRLGSNYRWTTR
jgi:hypothetical protein